MPNTNNPEQEQDSTDNKTTKSSMMDDAPLFAGLDDFILFQPVRKEKPVSSVAPAVEKKKTASRRPAEPLLETKSLPQRTPKAPKSKTSDPNAVLLSVIEICSLLKISRATLVRMDKAGKIPGRIKLGGSVRFHRETIETWLQSLISSPPTP